MACFCTKETFFLAAAKIVLSAMSRYDNHLNSSSVDSSESLKDQGRIEVRVQSLDGIWIDREQDERPSFPWVTATVAFSGSASNMKVGSSSVCGITGQLLVESEPVAITSSALLSANPRLAAHWLEEKKDGVTQPHMTMEISNRCSDGSKKSLQKGNRGAKLVKRDLEITQTESTVTESTMSTSGHDTLDDDEECASRKAVWSESGATMPEIIEMYIRLRHDGDATDSLWDGVAFLVVYGHEEDRGTHCIELPVQKTSFQSSNNSIVCSSKASTRHNTRMCLSDEARLTVQVKVVPCRPTPAGPVASSIVASNGRASATRLAVSQSTMEAELGPLLKKLRNNERLAKQMCENQKRAMDVSVPSREPDQPLPPPPSGGFCYVSQWTNLFSHFASMAIHCDASRHDVDDVDRDENSTIATRHSLRLFTR